MRRPNATCGKCWEGNKNVLPPAPRRHSGQCAAADHQRIGHARRPRRRDREGHAHRLPAAFRAAHRGCRSEGGAAMTKVTVDLPPDEAMALAPLIKRLGYDDPERLSRRYDGRAKRDLLPAATNKLN